MTKEFKFHEYAEAFAKHYPELLQQYSPAGLTHVTNTGVAPLFQKQAKPERFERTYKRRFGASANALENLNKYGYSAASAYKGLICFKPATDLNLYSSLIWELQPKTIIELGALQGGSGLWFADQLDTLCGHGEVHSFEKFIKCVSPEAKHDRLHFHEVDLLDLATFDKALLDSLEHPWLVIDDAHANIHQVFYHLDEKMKKGDYYIIEDSMTLPTAQDVDFLRNLDKRGYRVDTLYADACGYNNTSAPNAWLKKFE